MGRTACTEPQCMYKGALYLYLWSRKSRAIPLLPLWAVRPVQNLSACTRVHFTFTYNIFSVSSRVNPLLRLYIVYRLLKTDTLCKAHLLSKVSHYKNKLSASSFQLLSYTNFLMWHITFKPNSILNPHLHLEVYSYLLLSTVIYYAHKSRHWHDSASSA